MFHWKSPAGQEAWVTRHGTWDHPPPKDLINDPAAGASRFENLLRETLCNGKAQLEKEQAEAEQAANEARERERLRRARKAQRLRERRQAAKPTAPPEPQPALIPNRDSESAEPAPF